MNQLVSQYGLTFLSASVLPAAGILWRINSTLSALSERVRQAEMATEKVASSVAGMSAQMIDVRIALGEMRGELRHLRPHKEVS